MTKNVKRLHAGLDTVLRRQVGVEQMMLVKGIPGTGKSEALLHWKLQHGSEERQVPYVRADKLSTARSILDDIVTELGELPAFKARDVMSQITARLSEAPRPIIVDEVDYLIQRGQIEILRDVHDKARVPVILVGMDNVDKKLMRFPPLYDRITSIVPFQPLDRDDIREMADAVCDVAVDDSAVGYIHERSDGKLRRITILLYKAERIARANDLKSICAAHLANGKGGKGGGNGGGK
jgi:DNA transposition AAA+ family ATPase